jgi:hypothetical protein
MIGIDPDWRIYYEGKTMYGHAIWPSPTITVATISPRNTVSATSSIIESSDLARAKLLFREDSFDPVTRIRRGRFYQHHGGSQPAEWSVQPHPAYSAEPSIQDARGFAKKRLYSFSPWPARHHLNRKIDRPTVFLGIQNSATIWSVIDIEHISTGEDLVTLKAKSAYGIIPDLLVEKIPKEHRKRIEESIETLLNNAFRAGPESVIDCCRDSASALLGAYFHSENSSSPTFDLAKLAKIAEQNELSVVASSSRIIARLHPRRKPNEKNLRQLRALTTEDEELAIQCLSAIIREINWG